MIKLEVRKRQPPPELTSSRPRPISLTWTGRLVALIGTLLPAAALVSGFWLHGVAVRDRALRESIQEQGVTVTGEVTDLSRTSGKSPRYNVAYRHFAGGQLRQGRGVVQRSEWNRLRKGSPITVRYLPASPARSWIAGYEPRGVAFWMGPAAALGLALLALLVWQTLRKQWMLLAEGAPAEAQVTRSKKVHSQHGAHYEVYYEFRTKNGALRSGHCSSRKSPPPVGASMHIVYNPDDPGRSARYPLSLVRPATT